MIVEFDKVSSEDWGLKLYEFQAPPPEPRTSYVDVPFRDGLLDFSTALTGGIMRYKNRTVTLSFDYVGNWEDWFQASSEINAALHGQKTRIQLDIDPDYYYLGRCQLSGTKDNMALGSITITADCDPYKYKLSPTVREFDVSGSEGLDIILQNDRMPTVPTVTTDAEITVEFGESTIVFQAGTRKAPALLLLEGANHMTLTGTGHIKFEYQEGAL